MPHGKSGLAQMTKTEKTEQGNEIVHPIEEELVSPPKPVVVPCSVGVSAKRTIPMGNYANVSLSVHLSVTVEPEDIEEAFEQVSEWVADKLNFLSAQVEG